MSLLFRLSQNHDVVLDKDVIKLVPFFKDIPLEHLRYIILAYDYFSPFHQLPLEERQRKSSAVVFGNMKDNPEAKSKELKKAIDYYRALQFDSRRETIQTYINKISLLNKMMIEEKDPRKMNDITEVTEKLMRYIKSIQHEIDTGTDETLLEGGAKLSFLEKNLHTFFSNSQKDKKYPSENITDIDFENLNETTKEDNFFIPTDGIIT